MSHSTHHAGSADPIPLARPSVGAAELAAVAKVLESGWLAGQGPMGTELEAQFQQLTGSRHAVALGNCTAGLHLALLALGVRPGDEVIVADYSFPATAHAVLFCGATPVFADVLPATGTIDVGQLQPLLSSRTKGVIGVDALGVPADWDPIVAFARSHGLFVVEDAACGTGGSYRGRPCGSFGDAAVFSLHARKGVTSGEGGVLTTDDRELAEEVRRRSCFGMASAFERQDSNLLVVPEFVELGYNYKLSDVLAAVAVAQMAKIDSLLARRRVIASVYSDELSGLSGLSVPMVPDDRVPTWQTYAVTLADRRDRDAVAVALRENGIGSNVGTYALHRQPVYASAETQSRCPVSSLLFDAQLALPMFPDLTREQQQRVIDTLVRLLSAKAQ